MIKSPKFKHNLRVIDILHNHEHFDVFEKYGVDKYLTSFGMFVSKKFSGRKIGEKLSLARLDVFRFSNLNFIFSISNFQ